MMHIARKTVAGLLAVLIFGPIFGLMYDPVARAEAPLADPEAVAQALRGSAWTGKFYVWPLKHGGLGVPIRLIFAGSEGRPGEARYFHSIAGIVGRSEIAKLDAPCSWTPRSLFIKPIGDSTISVYNCAASDQDERIAATAESRESKADIAVKSIAFSKGVDHMQIRVIIAGIFHVRYELDRVAKGKIDPAAFASPESMRAWLLRR